MNNKIYLFALMFVFFISFASAEVQTLGTFKQDEVVNVVQIGAGFDNCTIASILDPLSVQVSSNVLMNKTGNYYNSTFNQTSKVGDYIVNGFCSKTSGDTVWAYDFKVTLSGGEPSTPQSIVFLFIGFSSIFFFLLALFGSIKIPYKNRRNHNGEFIGINELKYVKLFLWFVSYLLLIFITFSFSRVAQFGNWDVAYRVINSGFWFLISFLIPVFIMLTVFGFIRFFDDKKINKMITRNLTAR